MAGEAGLGATQGALQTGASGAVAGLGVEAALVAAGLVAGPVGWAGLAIGAVAGAVAGGSLGFMGGSKARKAAKYARRAARVQQEREANAAEGQMLQYIREGRIARASSQAAANAYGISTSSLETSALSSVGSQLGYNIDYLAEDRRLYDLYSRYMRKAGRAAQQYQQLLALNSSVSSLLQTAGSLGQTYAKTTKAPAEEFVNSPEGQQYITTIPTNVG